MPASCLCTEQTVHPVTIVDLSPFLMLSWFVRNLCRFTKILYENTVEVKHRQMKIQTFNTTEKISCAMTIMREFRGSACTWTGKEFISH